MASQCRFTWPLPVIQAESESTSPCMPCPRGRDSTMAVHSPRRCKAPAPPRSDHRRPAEPGTPQVPRCILYGQRDGTRRHATEGSLCTSGYRFGNERRLLRLLVLLRHTSLASDRRPGSPSIIKALRSLQSEPPSLSNFLYTVPRTGSQITTRTSPTAYRRG